MKIRIALCALAAAAAATVFGYDSNVCGLLKVTNSVNNTIIGVPWVKVGTTNDESVTVAKLVKTDNLTRGDGLYYYDNGTWKYWTLEEGSGTRYWNPSTTVKDDTTFPAPSENYGIARGQALILERQNVTNETGVIPFYLYGQYTTSAVAAQTLVKGNETTPTYTLLASPKVEDFNPNGEGKIVNPYPNDKIIIPLNGGDNTIYTITNGVWGTRKKKTTTRFGKTIITYTWDESVSIPAGTGFWYVSNGGEGESNTTINW